MSTKRGQYDRSSNKLSNSNAQSKRVKPYVIQPYVIQPYWVVFLIVFDRKAKLPKGKFVISDFNIKTQMNIVETRRKTLLKDFIQ